MSKSIVWSADLAVGVPSIDEQHKELLARFNSLLQACNEGRGRAEVGKLLEFLHDYVAVHFCDEEALQQEHGYPEYEVHRQQHLEFVGRLNVLHKQYFTEGTSLSLVIQANNMLLEWLVNHIAKSDRKIGEFLMEKGGQG